jgi:hypothetical protein
MVPAPSDATIAAYLQGMQNITSIVRAGQVEQGRPEDVRQFVQTIMSLYRGAPIWVGQPNQNWDGQGVNLVQADLETMVVDQLHNGWLSESMISAFLMMFIHQQFLMSARLGRPGFDFFMVNSSQFSTFRQAGDQQRPGVQIALPAEPRRLVAPIHWGNHWGLMTYNPDTHEMQYWDSYGPVREANARTAYATFQRLLDIHRHRLVRPQFHNHAPTRGPWESDLQRNSYDCGIFVVENARRFIEDTGNHPTQRAPITTNLRAWLIGELHHYLTQAQEQTDEALADNRRRREQMMARRGGNSRDRPFTLSETPPPAYER